MELLIIVGLTLLNGFFSGAEIALLSVRRTRLEELAELGNRSARAALTLRGKPEDFLATVQVGITVVGATAAAFGGSTLTVPLTAWLHSLGLGEAADEVSLAVVVGMVSILSVILGELVPKSVSLRSSENISLIVARPLLLLSRAARPLVWFLTASSNLILRPFHDETSFVEGKLSADELRQLVEEAAETGSLHGEASEIAARAIELGEIRVGVLSIPRAQVVSISRGQTAAEVWATLKHKPHARYPVMAEDGETLEGYVVARELVAQLVDNQQVDVAAAVREIPFFSEHTPAVDVLRALQRAQQQLGAVVDEHGGLLGIVSVDDIMEELVGDIMDERSRPDAPIQKDAERSWLVVANIPVHELNRELELDLPQDRSYATLAGLMLHQAGRILKVGEELVLDGEVRVTVVDATSRQIRKVRLALPMPAQV